MRNLIYLLSFLFLINCKNSNINRVQKSVIKQDTVLKNEILVDKSDSILKKSNPFELNKMLCYWENYIFENDEIKINLKNYKTNKMLISEIIFNENVKVDDDSEQDFDKLIADYFGDFNFDGFKDFFIYYKGSTAMTSNYGIFLFNPKTQTFDYSEYLSENVNSIDTVDSKNKKLITTSYSRFFEVTKTHYFDKFGTVRFSEIITLEVSDTKPMQYKTYEKIVNGAAVITKKDSILSTEN